MSRLSRAARSNFARIRSWLRATSHRRTVESEMDAELASHLDLLTADLIRAGHAPEEAQRRARIELGGMLTHKENMRASLGLRWFDELAADLRYAVRLLRKSPGFTAIAATSLALAIGANTAIFSLAKSVLYDRLNVPHPHRLFMLAWVGDEKRAVHSIWGDFDDVANNGIRSHSFPYPIYAEMMKHPAGVESFAALRMTE